MRKNIYLLIAATLLSTTIFAQVTGKNKTLTTQSKDTTEGWTNGGFINITLSQSQFENWAAGGVNSISVNGLMHLFANYRKGKSTWENSLDMGYGILNQNSGTEWIKTDDKLELNSKYGRKAFKNWYYAGLLNFKTQMTAGYNYPDDSDKISNFLAPAYGIVALGLNYDPGKVLTFFVAPVSGKITIVNDQDLANAGAFGVAPAEYDAAGKMTKSGQMMRTEFGGYLRFTFKKDILKNINFQTKLELFSDYEHNPQNIDINWENIINMKINKYISASITTNLIYDDDIKTKVDKNHDGVIDAVGPRTQFKEVFGLGIAYKF